MRGSDTAAMPTSQDVPAAPTSEHAYDVDRHCDPRRAPCACCPLYGPRPAARGVPHAALAVVEINADKRIAADVVFDADDFDAAFDELDARYLAGEAAAHAHTWSVIARATPRSIGANSRDHTGLRANRPPPTCSIRAR